MPVVNIARELKLANIALKYKVANISRTHECANKSVNCNKIMHTAVVCKICKYTT